MRVDIRSVAESIDKEDVARRAIKKLGSLYAKSTHFVYELIQNASDSDSRFLSLTLEGNGLVARNRGRVFDARDVKAICTVSASSKDLTQIGTHGIGFKAVYTCTDRPQIYSSNSCWFCIENYVRPEEISDIPTRFESFISEGDTIFFLPFTEKFGIDGPNKITDEFRKLNRWTMLFLEKRGDFKTPQSLMEIEWFIQETGEAGQYARESYHNDPFPGVTRTLLRAGCTGVVEEDSFLIFRNEVLPPEDVIDDLLDRAEDADEEKRIRRSATGLQPIEIAFGYTNGHILPITGAVLFSYLPTQISTGFGFLIQARYQTTPARDNIVDSSGSSWNDWLIKETARFLPQTLVSLRDNGYLSASIFEALPHTGDNVPGAVRHVFEPVRDTLLIALREGEQLIPVEGNGYASANGVAYPTSSILRKLFQGDDLTDLLNISSTKNSGSVYWLADEINWSGRTKVLLTGAGVREIRAHEVVTWLQGKAAEWFSTRSHEWLKDLYLYLANNQAEWARLKELPIIREASGKHVCATKNWVFFPPKPGVILLF
ncbi:sacsin N-terminal ATP-binding-like domain-containing protein [Armatimonas sp.]|uniref:sacsin N-terminal ATP-binding-like domain-containing protein n=1 Tax=Armatimonas sp. TaxID=1872638 RepID=UPI00286B52BD|nr:hypothetical protein [Armatimonas sp.]